MYTAKQLVAKLREYELELEQTDPNDRVKYCTAQYKIFSTKQELSYFSETELEMAFKNS